MKTDTEALLENIYNEVSVLSHPPFFTLNRTSTPKLGGDQDLYCLEASALANLIAKEVRPILGTQGRLRTKKRSRHHFHIDILETKGALLHRFDIHGLSALPFVSSNDVDILTVFNRSKRVEASSLFVGTHSISRVDEAIFRFLIYFNSFWEGRDKIHHITWLQDNLSPSEKIEFHSRISEIGVEKLHLRRKTSAAELLSSLVLFYSPSKVLSFLVRAKARIAKSSNPTRS